MLFSREHSFSISAPERNTGHTVAARANYLVVFRVAGTAGFLAYGLGHLSNSIWRGQPWVMTLKEVVDGLVYGLLTAGTFGWLWPRKGVSEKSRGCSCRPARSRFQGNGRFMPSEVPRIKGEALREAKER